jgi:hypothetical protein
MKNQLLEEGRFAQQTRTDDNPETLYGIEPTSTALAMAIVELCSSGYSDSQFEPTKLGGVLCFIVDRKLKSRYLRLFDINTS